MSSNLNIMLNSSDKGQSEARGVLSKLFRKTLADINMLPSEFNRKMYQYLNDQNNGFYYDAKRRSSERSNLIKEMCRPHMTFKVFLKCLRFLQPIKAEINMVLTWASKRVTVHGLTITISDFAAEDVTEVPPIPVMTQKDQIELELPMAKDETNEFQLAMDLDDMEDHRHVKEADHYLEESNEEAGIL